MLSKPLTFEQDKNAIFLRNQIMHLHYTKLNDIKQRKNSYLPEISPNNNNNNKNKNNIINISNINNINNNNKSFNYHGPSTLQDSKTKEKQYNINHENILLYKKLLKIHHRSNQLIDESEVISGYLNVKKNSRERVRDLKRKLLREENSQIMTRIKETKPVINNEKYLQEYGNSKRIEVYLRKIHPSKSTIGVYLTKRESDLIREYDKNRILFNKLNDKKKIINNNSKVHNLSQGNIKVKKIKIIKDDLFNNNIDKIDKKEKKEKNLDSCNYNKNTVQSVGGIGSFNGENYFLGGGDRSKNKKKDECPFKIDKRILAKIRYIGFNNKNNSCNKGLNKSCVVQNNDWNISNINSKS